MSDAVVTENGVVARDRVLRVTGNRIPSGKRVGGMELFMSCTRSPKGKR